MSATVWAIFLMEPAQQPMAPYLNPSVSIATLAFDVGDKAVEVMGHFIDLSQWKQL